ncbi:hypothetical protein [Streptomyces syringium]|uniref:hypothetical protein n=1 Tax=Streptomyces syringium TaxID=76729 RepID=UPI003423859B
MPPSLKTRTFSAAADRAALAGRVSHDGGRYSTARRYWSYSIYAAGEAGQRDRLSLLGESEALDEHPIGRRPADSGLGRVVVSGRP